nr:hypothetical protein [uncultured Desulfobacter sp.]
MKKQALFVICLFLLFPACTQTVKMPESQVSNITLTQRHHLTAALYASAELKKNTDQQTSPLDTLSFPVGPQMIGMLQKNLPQIFDQVMMTDQKKLPPEADILIVPEILSFENHIPFPAYNPHTCKIVSKITCYDKGDNIIFTQTTTGNSQTGGNLFSGFKSQQLAAEAVHLALEDTVKQALEGLSEADELGQD